MADALSGTQASTGPASGTTATRLPVPVLAAPPVPPAFPPPSLPSQPALLTPETLAEVQAPPATSMGARNSTQATRTDVEGTDFMRSPKARHTIRWFFVPGRCPMPSHFFAILGPPAQCYPRLALAGFLRRE